MKPARYMRSLPQLLRSRSAEFWPVLRSLAAEELERLAGGVGSGLATGGMVTKLHAAQIATAAGCEMVIANGEKPEVLYDIVGGKRVGTRFLIPKSEEELL